MALFLLLSQMVHHLFSLIYMCVFTCPSTFSFSSTGPLLWQCQIMMGLFPILRTSTRTLTCTAGCFQVLEPGRRSKAGLFKPTVVRAETSLLPSRVRVATGRTPVALAAGSLDGPKSNSREGARKQVIVVVTAGWSILCFDHNLKLLWENNVQVGGW